MKPLIPTDSPLYLRRLVRALNSEAMTGNGFYAATPDGNVRCNSAKVSRGLLAVRSLAGNWIEPEGLSFCDCNGREISASRHQ